MDVVRAAALVAAVVAACAVINAALVLSANRRLERRLGRRLDRIEARQEVIGEAVEAQGRIDAVLEELETDEDTERRRRLWVVPAGMSLVAPARWIADKTRVSGRAMAVGAVALSVGLVGFGLTGSTGDTDTDGPAGGEVASPLPETAGSSSSTTAPETAVSTAVRAVGESVVADGPRTDPSAQLDPTAIADAAGANEAGSATIPTPANQGGRELPAAPTGPEVTPTTTGDVASVAPAPTAPPATAPTPPPDDNAGDGPAPALTVSAGLGELLDVALEVGL